MELYVNSNWTERYRNSFLAEAIACSENGNHATICTVDVAAEEADAKLIGALRELKLIPEKRPISRMIRGGHGDRDQGTPRLRHAKVER